MSNLVLIRKISPVWLTLGIINATAIPLILQNKKIEVPEKEKSMLNEILAKPPTTKAPKPKLETEKKRQQKNYQICIRTRMPNFCRSKYYWND